MTKESGIKVERAKSILKKDIQVNPRGLFSVLAKAAVNGAFLQFDDLAENGAELLDTLGLEAKPGEVAGLLIVRSLMQAMQAILDDNKELVEAKPRDLKALYKELNESLADNAMVIDRSFFEHPERLTILQEAKNGFSLWLKDFIPKETDVLNISYRFDAYFVDSLNDQWISKTKDYSALKEVLDTPFTQATERQKAWSRYRAYLQKQIEEPLFLESFSLRQVYVPLRAYYEQESEVHQQIVSDHNLNERIVLDLNLVLEAWLQDNRPDDAIRLITGGPGSGKSSFSKMFAAQQSRIEDRLILFIPLHLFRLSDDLVKAVGEFVQTDGFLLENPLERDNEDLRIFIVFDGLDELSQQGKIAEEAAKNFVEEVRFLVSQFNSRKTRLQVLITGREVVIQANQNKFKRPQQLLYLLPYYLSEERQDDEDNLVHKGYRYIDSQGLLKQDQRHQWWRLYGVATGKRVYHNLPHELDTSSLVEITSQPLLNYLVALSFERDKLRFSKDTNLNEIYGDLLDAVYERGYEQREHRVVEGINKQEFIGVLEEVALACWHGNGRTATVAEIETYCDNSGLKQVLDRFKSSFSEDSKANVTRLLTAFYFRESGDFRDGEKTFEFTHKSFGEYLAIKRLIGEFQLICDDLEERRRNFRRGCDEREALVRWATLCGPSALTKYLFSFIKDEIRLQNFSQVKEWQKTLCQLIGYMLSEGMPIEGIKIRPNYTEEMRQSRNAEEALLATLNACARVTTELSEIRWPSPGAFATWLLRLQGYNSDNRDVLALKCCSFLDLRKSSLSNFSLNNINLDNVDLQGAELNYASFVGAQFNDADLQGVELKYASFVGSQLDGANFKEAKLTSALLSGFTCNSGIFQKADFGNATLADTSFLNADFEDSNFENTSLVRVNIENSNLKGTIFDKKQ